MLQIEASSSTPRCRWWWSSLAAVLLLVPTPEARCLDWPPRSLDAAELQLALQRLTVVGSALYVGAHPDDENAALLAYLSQGRLVRTAYLSMTRGAGGQNLIGSEKGELMGLLRTQELLAARRVDGAEQYFTRAVDFGYTKSADEALRVWGHDEILGDVVQVIRQVRPDVIITRFPGDGQGRHGQHTASTTLALEAFHAAADPTAFPEQLDGLETWQAKRILWNSWRPDLDARPAEAPPLLSVDLGTYSPLLGRSFTETAAESRSMHKSQGFGASARRGSRLDYLEHLAGEPTSADLFEGVDLTWSRIAGGEAVGALLQEALASYDPGAPEGVLPVLLQAWERLAERADGPWAQHEQTELQEVIRAAAGMWLEAVAEQATVAPGEQIPTRITVINRCHYPFLLAAVQLPFAGEPRQLDRGLDFNRAVDFEASIAVPGDQAPTQPYWLREPGDGGSHRVGDPSLVGLPREPSPLTARVTLAAAGQELSFEAPLVYRWTDPVQGERFRRVEIVPRLSLELVDQVLVFPSDDPREVTVAVQSHASEVAGTLRPSLPAGWRVRPEETPFSLDGAESTLRIAFTITPPPSPSVGTLSAVAEADGELFSRGVETVDYPHITAQTLFPPAQARVVRLDLQRRGERVGYVMGSGDEVPEALRQIGYDVTLLSDADLEAGDLAAFDAIVLGVRAYNTRHRLAAQNGRLLAWVHDGGTLVVQYNTTHERLLEELGPYPFRISQGRITVEEAPVAFVAPQHPLLTEPNALTSADFDGWVQERGLYFPDQWDAAYEPVIASSDPGEEPLEGGILYARYGAGVYIYTGYSFFRQLPAGVPGAYRLFVNLISARGERHDGGAAR